METMDSTNSEIDFACPHCGQQYSVDPSMIGHSTRCQTCGKIIMISVPGRSKAVSRTASSPLRETATPSYEKKGFSKRDFALGAITTAAAFIVGIWMYQKGIVKITPANKPVVALAHESTPSSSSPPAPATSPTTTRPTTPVPTTRAAQPPKPKTDPGAALYKEAMRYYNGDDVLQDYTKAVELLKEASEKGSAEADGELAFIYWTGSANQKIDTALSLSYAQKSGTRKTQMAHQALGALYLFGVKDVLPQNFGAAYSEFMNAYDYYSSMFFVGLMRYHGVGTKEDKKGAAESFFSACKKRPKNTHAGRAALCLGYMYVNGEGVGKNVSEGESWLRWGGKYAGVIPAESIPSSRGESGPMEGYLAYSGYKMAREASGYADAYTWPGNMTLLEKAIELYFHRQLYK